MSRVKRTAKPTPENYRRRIHSALDALEDAQRIASARNDLDAVRACSSAINETYKVNRLGLRRPSVYPPSR